LSCRTRHISGGLVEGIVENGILLSETLVLRCDSISEEIEFWELPDAFPHGPMAVHHLGGHLHMLGHFELGNPNRWVLSGHGEGDLLPSGREFLAPSAPGGVEHNEPESLLHSGHVAPVQREHVRSQSSNWVIGSGEVGLGGRCIRRYDAGEDRS